MRNFGTEIIAIADDFYEAYFKCRTGKEEKDEFGRICYSVVNVPAIVNGAFAIELYLKSMFLKNKKIIRTHSIKKLFSFLGKEKQDTIFNKIRQKMPIDKSIEECLDGIDNAFEFWRYIYEKGSFGFGLNNTLNVLPYFLNVIKEEAKKDYS